MASEHTPTRQSVERDRRAWAEFLMQPEREKATEILTDGGERRCCLGHACKLFLGDDIDGRWLDEDSNLPEPLTESLGMWTHGGGAMDGLHTLRGFDLPALYLVNDDTDTTPQQIGAYLLTVIEGGDDTPFRPLSEFPDEAGAL